MIFFTLITMQYMDPPCHNPYLTFLKMGHIRSKYNAN